MEITLQQRNELRRAVLGLPDSVVARYQARSNSVGIIVADGETSARPWLYTERQAAAAEAPDEAEIMLYGPVVADEWAWLFDEDESVIIPSRLKARLAEITASRIVARQNSPGGDLWAGIATADFFDDERRAGREVVMRVDGLSASASSIITARGNEIIMGQMAELMIHNPWVGAYLRGDKASFPKQAAKITDSLERTAASLAAMYADRNRKTLTAEAAAKLMDDETYFTAEQAVEQGFADRIMEPPADTGEATEQAEAANTPWASLTAQAAIQRQRRGFFTHRAG